MYADVVNVVFMNQSGLSEKSTTPLGNAPNITPAARSIKVAQFISDANALAQWGWRDSDSIHWSRWLAMHLPLQPK